MKPETKSLIGYYWYNNNLDLHPKTNFQLNNETTFF